MTNIRSNDTNFGSVQFGLLSPQQCEKLHNASLEILERTGIRLYEPEAVELLKKAGAFVSEGNRVRIPAGLVEKAFNTVPRRVVEKALWGASRLTSAVLLIMIHLYCVRRAAPHGKRGHILRREAQKRPNHPARNEY